MDLRQIVFRWWRVRRTSPGGGSGETQAFVQQYAAVNPEDDDEEIGDEVLVATI